MNQSLTIALLRAREVAMGFFRPSLHEANLTEQQWRIIRILSEKSPIDFYELATMACILRPSLTGILSRMERDNLVLRFKPVTDQRKIYISLAPTGEKLYKQVVTGVNAGYQQIEKHFSKEKMAQLSVLLDEFIEIGIDEEEKKSNSD